MDKLKAAEYLSPLYDKDRDSMSQALFVNLFIQQNRVQTAFDKVSPEISTKQWLLLGMTANCPEPKTLTRIGQLMGCSRQNVKQLADSLEKKGFLDIKKGGSRSVCLELTEKADRYYDKMCEIRKDFLNKLYTELTDDDIKQLYDLQIKIFKGIEAAEEFALEKQASGKIK
ncbi:MAG: MarR family winged helix-turn-helix transcriptional regulator [Oscillospiraceae bacterium]